MKYQGHRVMQLVNNNAVTYDFILGKKLSLYELQYVTLFSGR